MKDFLNNFINEFFGTIKNIINKNIFWYILCMFIILESNKADILDKLLSNLPQISGFIGTAIGFYAGKNVDKKEDKKDDDEKDKA